MALKINPITGKFNLWKSAPDWNQNDETATDYIKNRTHYETIAEHVEMTDNEYDAKVASGSMFVQVKIDSVTVESNEYLKDKSSETGSRQEYNNILSALSSGSDGISVKNGTFTCKKIAINGIETALEYLEHPQGSPFYDREGVLGGTFYGADGTADKTLTNIICCYGNGFMLKYYAYVYHDKGYFLYLIDKTVYGEAPYTIDFYFECEQTIKKLDEKYLPDSVLAKEPKFKTGDVVYSTNVPNFHFGVMSWEDYEKMPTNSMDTKMPIGLVVDPVKRTFLFCELLGKYFCNSDNIENYFGGYTSFEDGAEAFERISKLKGTSKAADIPAFYGLRNSSNSGTIFYVKSDDAYVPALKEWKKAKEHLCTAFYGDDDSYAGFMDRLIALKNGITPSSSLFIGKHNSGVSKLFYSQLSTVGKAVMDGNVANKAYNMNGEMPGWDNATDEYACCPVFGIYTEE